MQGVVECELDALMAVTKVTNVNSHWFRIMYILLVSCSRGPDFDTELFGEKGVTVQKLLEELYEKVSLHAEIAFNNPPTSALFSRTDQRPVQI